MNEYIFTKEQIHIFIRNIYEIVLRQLLYTNTFSRMFKKYNNKEFSNTNLEDSNLDGAILRGAGTDIPEFHNRYPETFLL
jgi:uncharacterized protein YjbI with pentapeptide repeats